MTLPPVLRVAHVRREPAETFRLFTEQIGAWWPLSTHGVFGEDSAGISLVSGCLIERSHRGDSVVWAEVEDWQPPSRLTLHWHPGRGDGVGGLVEVTFTADGEGTRVELAHHGWEAFGELAEQMRRRHVGPSAWGFVLDHFADLADAGPGGAAPPDQLESLAEAYASFFAEASRPGFGDPPLGEWTAEQVVAHIAVNDDLMAAVCRGLIHDATPRFDNAVPNDRAVLQALVETAGDLPSLVELGRARAETLRLLLARLDEDQLAAPIPCHLIDGDRVMVDQPLPWGSLALVTQATYHLPLHTRQLAQLRPSPR